MADNNNDAINQKLDEVRDLLVADGMDPATAEALTNYPRPASPAISGNLADLHRMGAIAVTGKIPAAAMPAGQDQGVIETTNIEDAFAEPPVQEDGPTTPAVTILEPDQDVPETRVVGASSETTSSGDLESMTKAELQAEADRRGVEVNSSMTKAEMIAALGG
jgi:hypothetical protein